jgi:RND family efflux transporter MFP subunit
MIPSRRRVLFIAAVFAVGCGHAEAPPAEPPQAAQVSWDHLKTGPLEEWTELLGTVEPLPERAAQVSIPVAGQVVSVLTGEDGKLVAEGDVVKAAQVLLRLDDRVPKANRDKLVAAEKELEEAVKEAALAVELARIDVDSREKLLAGNSTGGPLASRVELEKARLVLQSAEAHQRAAKAKQATARAERQAAEAQLALYTVGAPIAGRIGAFHATLGQTLAVGTVVTEIIDLNKVDILCYAPAGTVAGIARGQKARLPDHDREGEVVFLAEQAQPETGNIAVKVRFDNKGLDLRAGTLQRVIVRTRENEKARYLPEDTLFEDQDPPAVLVAEPGKDKEGKPIYTAKRYLAKVGLRDRYREKRPWELLGLTDPETKKPVPFDDETRFIAEGGLGLEDGDLVKEKEEPKEEHAGTEKKD